MITIPTLTQLYNGVLTDLQTQFGVSISPFGKSYLRVQASVQAGKLWLLYKVIGNVQKNIFVDTADSEFIGGTLERFGRIKLGRNPFPATAAQYKLTVTGSISATIPAAMTFKSDDSSLHPGLLYILDSAYTLTATTDYIYVRALTTGVAGKLSISDTLTATAPIALVDSSATVYAETVAPLDAEDLEAYRTAIINSYRLEAQGGSAADYRLWAQDAQGVKIVYPYAKSGTVCEINLYVEATVADSTDGKGTPTATILNDVESVVEFNPDTSLPLLERGRRPLGVFQVHYLPVTIKTVDIIISGYTGITPAIQAILLTAITDAINLIRPFVSAADVLTNKNDIIDVNKIIGVIITQQPVAIFSGVTIKIDSVSMLTYQFTGGDIPYLNSVTYI